MRFNTCCKWDVGAQARNIRARNRDGAMSVGPENYTEFIADLRVAGWGKSTPIYNHEANGSRLNETIVEKGATPQAPDDGTKDTASLPTVVDLVHDEADTTVEISATDHVNKPSISKDQPGSRDCTETTSKAQPETERIEVQTTTAVERDSDSDLEIIETRSSPVLKRKPSATPTKGPATKRAKHNDVTNSEHEGESARATKATGAQTIESGASEEGSDSDYEEEEEDPEAAQKLAAANREIQKVCTKCKSDANRALKYKHEREISKLKRVHHNERSAYKANAAQVLKDVKDDARVARKEMKAVHREEIQNLETAHNKKLSKKLAEVKAKHDAAIEAWQEKRQDDVEKIKKLANERDVAIVKRKEIEKSTATRVRDARNDLEAGKRKLREERKQMLRESREEIAQLKPEHSNVVKNNETIIKEMTQHIMNLENELGATQRDLTAFQTDSAANRQRYNNCKIQLAHSQKETSTAKDGLHAFEKYASGVEKRAQTEVARAKEKHEVTIANLREQSERVITLQRENYKLKDSVQVLSQLGREKREEARRLKAELEATKAELGLDIAEALDSVEQT